MAKPKRIQRKRTAGWRMPEGAVYVGRPSVYGNPFKVGVPYYGPTIREIHSRTGLIVAFSIWINKDTLNHLTWDRELIVAHTKLKAALERGDLAGRDLVCWCPLDQPCHADVLLQIANEDQRSGLKRRANKRERRHAKTEIRHEEADRG